VTIGNYSCIASTAAIGGMEHSYWYPSISPVLSNECIFGRETKIGNDVWIGAHVCVKQGVSIGDGAVIGAGSVVTHDIPSYTIAYGVPAKIVKKRFDSERKEKLIRESKFWEFEPDKAKEMIVRIENIE
jgi:acetyltransferase-like isoleucine patch superfamily enzyme